MLYTVSLIQTEEGFAVSVPSLPGCHSQDLTEQEALTSIAEAIRDCLAVADDLAARASDQEV